MLATVQYVYREHSAQMETQATPPAVRDFVSSATVCSIIQQHPVAERNSLPMKVFAHDHFHSCTSVECIEVLITALNNAGTSYLSKSTMLSHLLSAHVIDDG